MQNPSHCVCPVGHELVHVLFAHNLFVGDFVQSVPLLVPWQFPVAPQKYGFVFGSMHSPSHSIWPLTHDILQTPPVHFLPSAQFCPL